MPPSDDLVVDDRLIIPAAELRESFVRSGGPGGQNVNKVASKVELRWRPADSATLTDRDRAWLCKRLAARLTGDGELVVTSSRNRDQARNRVDARAKLALIIREALRRPKARRATCPTAGSQRRRVEGKKRRGALKQQRRSPADD